MIIVKNKKPYLGDFNPKKDKVFEEKNGNVFVFGSNLSGVHGGGAAATARQKYGAIDGKGEGLQGIRWKRVNKVTNVSEHDKPFDFKYVLDGFKGVNGTLSYALPTKGFDIETLPLVVVEYFVGRLNQRILDTNMDGYGLTWFVTRVGCGLGGWTDKDIAPLFQKYQWPSNVTLPNGWE